MPTPRYVVVPDQKLLTNRLHEVLAYVGYSIVEEYPGDGGAPKWRLYHNGLDASAFQRGAAQDIIDNHDPLAELRRLKLDELSRACKSAIVAGVQSDATGESLLYPTAEIDQTNLQGVVQASLVLGESAEPYKYICGSAVGIWERREHTAAQIQAVGIAVFSHVVAMKNTLDTLRGVVLSARTQADIEAVAWPA